MNEFDSIQTDKGILKEYYSKPAESALNKRLKKRQKELQDEAITSQFNDDVPSL